MVLGKFIPRYSLLPRPLRVLAALGSGLLALLLLSFLLLTLTTLWINNTERGQAWLAHMLTGLSLSPASGITIDVTGLHAAGPAHIALGKLEARYKDQTFLSVENAIVSFSLASLAERQPVIGLVINKAEINSDILAALPVTNNDTTVFQVPDIAALPFDSLRVSDAHIESLTITAAGSRLVYAPRLTALLVRHGALLDITATLEDTAHDLGRLTLTASLQSAENMAIHLHRLSYNAPDFSAVLTGQAHWPDFQPDDKILGLVSSTALSDNDLEDVYIKAPLNWPIPLTLSSVQNGHPVSLNALIDRASPYLDLTLPSLDWQGFALRDVSAKITGDAWLLSGSEKNNGTTVSLEIKNERMTGFADLGKAGNVVFEGATGESLDVTATIKDLQPHLLRGTLKTALAGWRSRINGTVKLSGSRPAPLLRTNLEIKTLAKSPLTLMLEGDISTTLAKMTATATGKGIRSAAATAELPVTFSLAPFTFYAADKSPLSGSAKIDGDITGLAPLFLPVGFTLGGATTLAATLAGTRAQPAARGSLTMKSGRLQQAGGIALRDISLDAGFTSAAFDLRALKARDEHGGTITLAGRFANQPGQYPATASLRLEKIDLSGLLATASDAATAQAVKGKLSGDLALGGSTGRYTLKGTLTAPQIDITIPERFGDSVPQLNIVERKGKKSAAPPLSSLALDIALTLPERIFVRGWGLDAEFGGALSVLGTAETPLVEGRLDLLRGRYEEFGRRLTLSKASLDFRGTVPPSPYLDVLAETRVDDTTVQVRLGGNIDAPKINFTAIPPMPEDEALSRLLFGRNLAAISPAQGLQLAQTLRRFSGQGWGIDPLGLLRAGIGLDDLDIESDDEGGASVGAGKYLAKDVYLEVQSGTARKSGGAKLRIDLAPNVKFESRVGQDNGSGGGIFWEREY